MWCIQVIEFKNLIVPMLWFVDFKHMKVQILVYYFICCYNKYVLCINTNYNRKATKCSCKTTAGFVILAVWNRIKEWKQKFKIIAIKRICTNKFSANLVSWGHFPKILPYLVFKIRQSALELTSYQIWHIDFWKNQIISINYLNLVSHSPFYNSVSDK